MPAPVGLQTHLKNGKAFCTNLLSVMTDEHKLFTHKGGGVDEDHPPNTPLALVNSLVSGGTITGYLRKREVIEKV